MLIKDPCCWLSVLSAYLFYKEDPILMKILFSLYMAIGGVLFFAEISEIVIEELKKRNQFFKKGAEREATIEQTLRTLRIEVKPQLM